MSNPSNLPTSRAVADEATEIGSIVHDLRNVLSAVRGYATVVSEDLRPDDPARQDLEQILRAVDLGTAVATRLSVLRSRITAARPAAAEDAGVERSSPSALAAARGQATVLVVEDDDLVRMMTVRVLRRNGYLTLDAATAEDAEEKAHVHAQPLDLLLADVGLPQGGGPELAARLQQRWPTVKVLFMSGLGRAALAEQGITLGGAFLEKPFAPLTLVERIDALLTS